MILLWRKKTKKETHPSRMRGRGVEVSKTLFYFKILYMKNEKEKNLSYLVCKKLKTTWSERENVEGTHVDWWIYEESDPQKYFGEVKNNE